MCGNKKKLNIQVAQRQIGIALRIARKLAMMIKHITIAFPSRLAAWSVFGFVRTPAPQSKLAKRCQNCSVIAFGLRVSHILALALIFKTAHQEPSLQLSATFVAFALFSGSLNPPYRCVPPPWVNLQLAQQLV